jgi:hypothetical protein
VSDSTSYIQNTGRTEQILSLHHRSGEVVEASAGDGDGGMAVDETGLDIIDALDIFMAGAATQDTSCGDTSCGSTCCGHKNSLQVSRSSSPAADILASRGILAAQMASSQSSSCVFRVTAEGGGESR